MKREAPTDRTRKRSLVLAVLAVALMSVGGVFALHRANDIFPSRGDLERRWIHLESAEVTHSGDKRLHVAAASSAEDLATSSREGRKPVVEATALAERLYFHEGNVLRAKWVGQVAPGGARLRVMVVTWRAQEQEKAKTRPCYPLKFPPPAPVPNRDLASVRTEPAEAIPDERTRTDLLMIDDDDHVCAQIEEIGDVSVWCDGGDGVWVGGTRVTTTPDGFIIRQRAMDYGQLCVVSNPDPSGCLREGVIAQRPRPDDQTTATSSPTTLDRVEQAALERLFPPLEGPPDDRVTRTVEVLSKGRTTFGSICVVFVTRRAHRQNSDVLWVTRAGDIVATLSGVRRDAIREVDTESITLAFLERPVRLRHDVLEASVRYLNRRMGDGPFAHD